MANRTNPTRCCASPSLRTEEALGQYATEYKLMNVQTTNMGSLFQLEYMLRLKEQGLEKALIDELRCLNGNLKISLGYAPKTQEVL